MEHPCLYLDEDVYHGVAVGLRRRGFNVLTTAEAKMIGSSDEKQIHWAIAQRRCLFTFNRGHFAELHASLFAQEKHHYGIIVCRQSGIGWVIHKLCALLSTHSSEDLRDRLIWLAERQQDEIKS